MDTRHPKVTDQAPQAGNVTIENDRPSKAVAVVKLYPSRSDPMGPPLLSATIPVAAGQTITQGLGPTITQCTIVTVDIYDTDSNGDQSALGTTYGQLGVSVPGPLASVKVVVGAGTGNPNNPMEWNSTVTLSDITGNTLRTVSQAYELPFGGIVATATPPSPGNYLVMQFQNPPAQQNGAPIVQGLLPAGAPIGLYQTWRNYTYWTGYSPVHSTLCSNMLGDTGVSALGWAANAQLATQLKQNTWPNLQYLVIYYSDIEAYQIVNNQYGTVLTSVDGNDQTQLQYMAPDSSGVRQYWNFPAQVS